MPDLTGKPEKSKLIFQAWKKLPDERKAILRQIMARPCAWCQDEFKLPAIGKSHGMCARHEEKTYKEMGLGVPTRQSSSYPTDLSTLSPQERSILKFLYSIVYRKRKEKASKSHPKSPSPDQREQD